MENTKQTQNSLKTCCIYITQKMYVSYQIVSYLHVLFRYVSYCVMAVSCAPKKNHENVCATTVNMFRL